MREEEEGAESRIEGQEDGPTKEKKARHERTVLGETEERWETTKLTG